MELISSEEQISPTLMHRQAYNSNWSDLMRRLESNPEECGMIVNETEWFDPNGASLSEDEFIIEAKSLAPIHILCTRRNLPKEILEKYFAVYPEVFRLLTSDERSALHLACYSQQSLEVIQFIATKAPDTLSWQEAFDGWNALHICIYAGVGEGVILSLLDIVGENLRTISLISKDKHGRSPLILACNVRAKITKSDFEYIFHASKNLVFEKSPLEELSRNYHSYISACLALKPPPKSFISNGAPSPFCNNKKSISVESLYLWRPEDSLNLWRCIHKVMVVLGMDSTQGTNISTFPLLHECLRQDPHCRTHIFYCILSLNPYYACQIDANGDLPLHIAARHAEATSEWKSIISHLLIAYPKAASIQNRQAKFGLEILVTRNTKWSLIRPFLRCYPQALSRFSLHSTLYSKILSKLSHIADYTSIFMIIKEMPDLCSQ